MRSFDRAGHFAFFQNPVPPLVVDVQVLEIRFVAGTNSHLFHEPAEGFGFSRGFDDRRPHHGHGVLFSILGNGRERIQMASLDVRGFGNHIIGQFHEFLGQLFAHHDHFQFFQAVVNQCRVHLGDGGVFRRGEKRLDPAFLDGVEMFPRKRLGGGMKLLGRGVAGFLVQAVDGHQIAPWRRDHLQVRIGVFGHQRRLRPSGAPFESVLGNVESAFPVDVSQKTG